MSVRTFFEDRSTVIKVIVALLVVAFGIVLFQLRDEAGIGAPGPQNRAWFTIDDGQTWFADDALKCPPFQSKGKTAYRVHVFTTDGGRTKFAGFLERYTPDAKKALEEYDSRLQRSAAAATNRRSRGSLRDTLELSGKEVKLPKTGDGGWTKITDPKANEIVAVKPPSGNFEQLEVVLP